MRKTVLAAATAALFSTASFADFRYQETSKITGGMMAGMMKVAGVFSKSAREPIQSTVAVKGNRMVRTYADHAEIIDLDAQTYTDVNFKNKTYSTVTFAEMKQAMDAAFAKASESKDGKVEMSVKVSVNETGQTKTIAGFNTKEAVMKMEMETTDAKSGQKGSMVMTSDMWLAPEIAGYQEVQDFQKRVAEKMGFSPGGNMLMANPQLAKGMAGMYQEMSKIKGVPVFQTVSMGGMVPPGQEGQAEQQGQAPAAQQPPPQREERASAPSPGGALGGAIGGRLGRLGGLGRKRQQEAPQPAPQQQEQQPAPAAQSGGRPGGPGSLIEMTVEMTDFSAAPVDPSLLQPPAGFKQVESERLKRMR